MREETKQEQGNQYLSKQLRAGWAGTISWKKHSWKKTRTVNKKKAILENRAFLRNKKAIPDNKRTLLENKRAVLGNKRANLENKRAISGNKGTCNLTCMEWSFLDVSSQNKISKIFLRALFSHESDILTIKFPKISPAIDCESSQLHCASHENPRIWISLVLVMYNMHLKMRGRAMELHKFQMASSERRSI